MKIYILLFSLIIAATLFAQDEGIVEYDTIVVSDLESWHKVQFEYKFNKKLKLKISEQVRLEENSLKLERFFTQVQLKYKFEKGFAINAGYRFITEQKSSGLSNGHRWNIDGLYSKKLNRFKVAARIRMQTKIEFPKADNARENYLRFKLKLDYNIKNWKLDPYFSNEIFRHTNNVYKKIWDKYRFTVGTNNNFNKQHSLSIFYGAELDLNITYPQTTYLVGLGYKFTLKAKSND